MDKCDPGAGPDEIRFAVDGVFVLAIAGTNENAAATGDLDIIEALTITGNGVNDTVIDGNDLDRVFRVLSVDPNVLKVDANLSGLTIRNGKGPEGAGLINGDVGTVTLTDCAVLNNEGSGGAGLNNDDNGTMDITRCTIDGNKSIFSGGGVRNDLEGWLFLAILLDLYSKQVVGWSMRHRNDTQLLLEALNMAVLQRRPAPGLIHHSDRGRTYAGQAYRARLSALRMTPSMSRKGDCWDNAVAESFFATLELELIEQRVFPTRLAAKTAIFEFIEVFYNRQRAHQSLNYRTPLQVELQYRTGS